MVPLPPAEPPQQALQPSFQADFDQTPPAQMQPQQQQLQQQQSNQMPGFASFPSTQPQQPQAQQQNAPQMLQQDVQNTQQGGFANFSSLQQSQPQMQMQQPNLLMHGGVHTGNNDNLQQTQGGGGISLNQPSLQPQGNKNVGQVPRQQPSQIQMMQQPPQQQQHDQSGFANFSSVPQQQIAPKQAVGQPLNNIQMQAEQQQQQQQQIHQPNTGHPSIQPTAMTQPAQQPAPQPSQPASTNQGDATPTMNQRESVVSDIAFDETYPSPSAHTPAPAPAPPSSNQTQTDGEHSTASGEGATVDTNPNAFRSVDDGRKNAFDSGARAGDFGAPSTTSSPPVEKKTKDLNFTKYHEGQQVVYSSMEGTCLATVAKVHYDDELHPFYTIHVNGREKQTDDAHLSMMQDNANSVAPTSANNAILLQETASMLRRLNSQQLTKVHQFVASMVASGNNIQGRAAPPPGQNLQMNSANLQQQQQNPLSFGSVNISGPPSMGNDLPFAPMSGAPMPPLAQYSMQQSSNHGMTQTTTMGMSAGAPLMPPPAHASAATAQSFMQQNGIPNQQHSTMGVGTTNNTVQQTSNHRISPGAMMGMGVPPQTGAPTPPATMPLPPPQGQALAGVDMGQLAKQQQQQPLSQHGAMGMEGTMNSMPAAAPPLSPAAAASPALPPVEKEGNPFDFY
eukprot:CAMPEP_0181119002 /NCGR_PEP_ID=MMETSP1071-20121207/23374_1 /TAXON_ID=35127 /ORGANISM="Thalassiosira sp., Strain NH16" /LENGTH=675 /DNA_ID=CAMNT_0023203529 /DNA_START=11 /DNA_END=2039 /DNA_ORIENTATION=+